MTDRPEPYTRRAFLESVGALSLAGIVPAEALASVGAPSAHEDLAAPGERFRTGRGLAAPDDFAFAPGLVYLQTGSLGPTPRPVMERSYAAWQQIQLNPAAFAFGELQREMEGVRAQVAAFAGCKAEEIVLTSNTTQGMNWTAQGLSLNAGDRVLTTDQEHPGGRVCWDYIARRCGVELDVVPIAPDENDPQAIIDRIDAAFTPRTRVLSVSHILSSTGLRMPVADLCALARSRDCIAVVDGAQATGTGPIDVKQVGCHVYASSGHKWLLGPPGTGFLYLSEELADTVDPIALQSGRAAYSASSGTRTLPNLLGLGAALEYLTAIGLERVEAHNHELRRQLYEALLRVPRIRIVSGAAGPLASSMVTYRLPDEVDSGALHRRMREQRKIELKVVPRNWFNGHRVSLHLFNSEEDVEALVEGLRGELG